ncbi:MULTISPECIES: malonate decarboxylase subunit alpha [unclassified Streptomyces]|uniref:malonate decarboxylase subunit alpha n=1 Tax=unclassified Streptomyces TaxID=2593676 RepID=UPI002E27F4B6|nr:malonate decarboxylase subunit alpha [Streptomyces sp. NBC_00223]
MRILTAQEAVRLIPEGATVALSGGSYRAVAESLLEALAERFDRDGTPTGLTVVAVSMVERSRRGEGGAGTGLNLMARPGMVTRVISGSYARNPEREINRFVRSGDVPAYNYPMGTILQWLRATAAGRGALLTPVGIGTFADPRLDGGRVVPGRYAPLNRVVEVDGEELLSYPRLPVDVALVKATSADRRGNLYADREAYDHGAVDVAMAARNSGGIVLAEVNRIVDNGEVHPRFGRIPGPLVDAVVLRPDPWEDEQDPGLTGERRVPLPEDRPGDRPRDTIARAVVSLLPEGGMVNLGAGLPMYDVPAAARLRGRDDLYFTVEQGPMGGRPLVGGAALNPEMIMGQLEVFDFYEGGGPDLSVLAFGEIDRHGHVNVSRFGGMMPGSGGFVNIVHGARELVFCGTLTTGGLRESVVDGRLVIEREGTIRRFVDEVEQITFNGTRARAAGRPITVVTERAVFAVTGAGYRLDAVMPGVDIRRDVLAHIPFPVAVAREPRSMGEFLVHTVS